MGKLKYAVCVDCNKKIGRHDNARVETPLKGSGYRSGPTVTEHLDCHLDRAERGQRIC